MSQHSDGLSRKNVSLLGYLVDHPEVSKKLYKFISETRKEQSRPSPMEHIPVCYIGWCKDWMDHIRQL